MSLAPRRKIGGGGRGGRAPFPQDEAVVVQQLLTQLERLERQVEEKQTSLTRQNQDWRETWCEEAHLHEQLRELNEQLAKEELEDARLNLEIVTLRNAYEAGVEWVHRRSHALLLLSSHYFISAHLK